MHIQDDPKEQDSVDLLTAMMGDLDPEVARRVLRKCDGDVQKAATAILEGDRGDDIWIADNRTNKPAERQRPHSPQEGPPRRQNTPVIDLTGDDDNDLSRALQASLETQQQEPKFGPSERPPDPNWAVVPSNVESGSDAQYYQTLDRAIKASLDSTYDHSASEAYEPLPPERQVRENGCPVALRPTQNTMTYAALILQGLYFVPQIRERVAGWRPSAPPGVHEIDTPMTGHEHILWLLLEIFVHMDLAQLSDLNIDSSLGAFEAEPWLSLAERPGDLSNSAPRFFYFQYGHLDADPKTLQETCIVKVEVGGIGSGDNNDLISRLSAQLSKHHDQSSKQEVIFEPSEVVTFQLSRSHSNAFLGGSNEKSDSERKPFRYPKHIFMDQFLEVNAELVNTKRAQQREMNEEIQKLMLHKKSLTHFNDKDTVKDLTSAIYYYEHVAEAKDDPERAVTIQTTATKLRSILAKVEKEIEATDAKITKIRSDSANLFECPELQKARYDLRVAYIHDGLFGRKHLYSYVYDNGSWWKSADSSVSRVPEETVLNDEAGLHLSAGPFLLIYSRALPERTEENSRLSWPEVIKNSVKHNNQLFLSNLPPELIQNVHDPQSPPSFPITPSRSLAQTPSELTIDSTDVEPPLSRDELMDVSTE
ncbi:hypothetical protein SERLA73DRAFT_117693 [Serpula lacrymans var. lacrymans S7.3]|uniref:Peptidase C19 ubiquitin carboxyl-terminal hydrolase domain-containing protein n=1 Tax=Serpula lacrymans var. lacrymans (strain S7.3) TaxID=936435 RepID=F8QHP4_SERL3|nr:hypothetical protein SERLA73DRAFT_117693 [Serpula lacrymans var. lacrymans S7.3]